MSSMLKALTAILIAGWLVTNAGAYEEMCFEHNLSWIDTTELRAQYNTECAPRPGDVEMFWRVVAEYRKQRDNAPRAFEEATKRPKDPRSKENSEVAGLNLLTARDMMQRVYLGLYELERREVFNQKGNKEIRLLIEAEGGRLGKLTPRQAFARRYIHGNRFDERDGLSALSEEAHKRNDFYVNELRRIGLPAKSP